MEVAVLEAERVLRCLSDHQVSFVLIGALAATMQGSPLRTEDIDICPAESENNLRRLAAALKELDAKEWDLHRDDVVERDWSPEVLRADRVWILSTKYGRLDLVFIPAGSKGYEELAASAVDLAVEDLVVRVASLDDIIRSKEALGREQDLAQLPTLRQLAARTKGPGRKTSG